MLVKEMTDVLIDNGHSVAVVCDAGEYSNLVDRRADVCDLKGTNDLSKIKRFIKNSSGGEVFIVAFNAASAAISENILRYANKCGVRAKVIVGVYHPRTFLESKRVSPLGYFSRLIASSLGHKSVYFMNDDCRHSHAVELSSSFSSSQIVLLPVIKTKPRWRAGGRESPSRTRIVSVGRITAFKAYNFASTDMVSRLRSRGVDVLWDIFGWGEDEESLITHLRGQEFVRFHGKIDSSSFDAVVENYDLFIGMGMSAIRASQLGVPTVLAIESHGHSCLGYSYQSPPGNVGEVPRSVDAINDVVEVIEGHSKLTTHELVSVSNKCIQWADQFDYGNFIDSIDAVFAQSSVSHRLKYRVASYALLFGISIKSRFRLYQSVIVRHLGVSRTST